MSALELPPDHLVDHADVALDDADDLGVDAAEHEATFVKGFGALGAK